MSSSSRKSSFTIAALPEDMTFLDQDEAASIDADLRDEYGFLPDQIMELAGLAVATAIVRAYPASPSSKGSSSNPKILLCAGPGNVGGIGLVAARHLKWFTYDVCIFCPKPAVNTLFASLRRQCEEMEISFMSFLPDPALVDSNFAIVVDALLGCGYKPPIPPEYVDVLQKMCKFKVTVVSVDLPLGWDVEMGPNQDSIKPAMVVSIIAPKKGLRHYRGRHFLAGRYIPKSLATKFNLILPPFPGTDIVVPIG